MLNFFIFNYMSPNKKYTAKLSRKDKKTQIKASKGKKAYATGKKALAKDKYIDRPKLNSYKKKVSSWTTKFHNLYPKAKIY